MRIILGIALTATLALVACGGGDDGSAPATSAAAGEATVSVRQLDGVGALLVDARGSALYVSDQEADGTVRCVEECAAIWEPLVPGDGEPTSTGDAGTLGVVTRPDGGEQVTVGGRPLYTFAQDAGDEVTGDGLADDFGGQRFTWHAALAGGTASDGGDGARYGGY
jgi:predicted lipoprotein with Yx(FWY)xxD motif